MGKQEFLERIRTARAELNEAISGLSEEQVSQDIAVGEWTVKDILAHLATWQHEATLGIKRAAEGAEVGPLIAGSIEEWNAARVNERRRLPLFDVMQEFNAVYDALLAMLESWPEAEVPLGPAGWDETARLWWLTEHDGEHLAAIRAYRERLAQG